MTARPVAVEPVNEIMSTRGSPVRNSPAAGRAEVSTLTTPGGMSVWVATIRPSSAPVHGVSGAGLSTTVQPAASAGPSLARLIWLGKFHGVIAATTPAGSRYSRRLVGSPIGEAR